MTLQEIRSIIGIIKSDKVLPLKNLFRKDTLDTSTKLYALFKGIESGNIQTDEEAASEIYQTDPLDQRYMMLRINLSHEVVQNLSLYDYSKKFSELTNKTAELQRTLFGIEVLLFSGQRQLATWFTKRLLKEATEYEITLIRLNCLRILRRSALYKGDIPSMEEYSRELKNVIRLYNKELQAEELCEEVEIHFVQSTARNQEIADRAYKFESELQKASNVSSSSTLELYRYRMLLYALQISAKFHEAIEICNQARQYLEKHPLIDTKARQAEFMLRAMECSIVIRDYTNAIAYGTKCLKLYTSGNQNWYIVLNHMLLCALHTGHYTLATELHLQASKERSFKNLSLFDQDKWKLYNAYLVLLSTIGIVKTEDRKLNKTSTSGKFISIIPEAAKDKTGLNIPIHILHILYPLFSNDYEQISLKINAFHKYAQRYLNKEEHYRSLIFLDMLKILKRNQYDVQKAKGSAEALYQELLLNPQKKDQFVESNEIIPYDTLWQWILKRTETPLKVTRRKRD